MCHTDGKGEGMRWRTWTPDRQTHTVMIKRNRAAQSTVTTVVSVLYLCSGTVNDHLESAQQVDQARNIPQCLDDPQAGSWSVNAFLGEHKVRTRANEQHSSVFIFSHFVIRFLFYGPIISTISEAGDQGHSYCVSQQH